MPDDAKRKRDTSRLASPAEGRTDIIFRETKAYTSLIWKKPTPLSSGTSLAHIPDFSRDLLEPLSAKTNSIPVIDRDGFERELQAPGTKFGNINEAVTMIVLGDVIK